MPSAGDIKGGDVQSIGPGLIRLDLERYDGMAFCDGSRTSAVLNLTTARALTIALIEAIKTAEIGEARKDKKRK